MRYGIKPKPICAQFACQLYMIPKTKVKPKPILPLGTLIG